MDLSTHPKAARRLCLVLAVLMAMAVSAGPGPRQAFAASGLSPDLRRMVELALENGALDVVTATVKLAAKAAPGTETEILAIVAARAPDLAPAVGFSLGLRERTAEAAVIAAEQGSVVEATDAALEAQRPRFFSFEGWSGTVALGISATTGNSRQREGSVDVSVQRTQGTVSYELTLLADLADASGEATRERYAGSFQLNRDLSDRLFLFGGVEAEQDRFTGFDYRAAFTPGVGYRVVNQEKKLWRVQGGPTVRLEEPQDASARTSVGASVESLFRWTSEGGVTLENESDAIATRTTTVSNRVRLGFPLLESLSLALSNEVRYDFSPPADAESLDTTTRASIAYSF
ncbi:MAG: YdiY family protein [Alphaproteobacteria bacterium]